MVWAFTGGDWLLRLAYLMALAGLAFLWAGFAVVRRSAGDASWVNPLIFQIMLVCSIALAVIGSVVEIRRKRQG